MDSVVEKLGFFDFLNYIITGMYTIVGAFIISYQFGFHSSKSILDYLVNQPEVNSLFFVLSIVSILAIAYSLGIVGHEVFSFIDHTTAKTYDSFMEGMFTEKVFDNSQKIERYKILAKEIFDNNEVHYSTIDKSTEIAWTAELYKYFFSYCEYQVQIRGLNKKPEKLRDIEELEKSFCGSSILLLIQVFICGSFKYNHLFLVEAISLVVLTVIFVQYRNKALKNRIRMTLALFEAIYDKERKSPVE